MANNILQVERYNLKSDWTLGKLSVFNKIDGFTVEDEVRAIKLHGETAIPYGVYPLGYRQSPKFSSSFLYSDSVNKLIEPKDKSKYPNIKDWRNHDLIWVQNVPGFQYILIHWGNTDDDTEGCLIVGSKIGIINGQEGVLSSRVYYKNLYPRIYPIIKQGNQFIEYIK